MKRMYAGIFFVSLSALFLPVTLTRILSVMLWYNYTYLIIGIALLGYGAAGSRLTVLRHLRDDSNAFSMAQY